MLQVILFHLRDSGGGVWKKGLLPEVKPRVTSHLSRPPPPLNPKSQIVSLPPERLAIICFIIPP